MQQAVGFCGMLQTCCTAFRFVTSPAGAVTYYCDEHVCVSVCLYEGVSPEPDARSLPHVLCMLPMAVAGSYSGRMTKSQGESAILGVSSPLTMHCNAFAPKGIIQSPITSRSRRDHSVCQEAKIGIRKILSAGDAAYRMMRVHRMGEV